MWRSLLVRCRCGQLILGKARALWCRRPADLRISSNRPWSRVIAHQSAARAASTGSRGFEAASGRRAALRADERHRPAFNTRYLRRGMSRSASCGLLAPNGPYHLCHAGQLRRERFVFRRRCQETRLRQIRAQPRTNSLYPAATPGRRFMSDASRQVGQVHASCLPR
jgi:hypothetical protein